MKYTEYTATICTAPAYWPDVVDAPSLIERVADALRDHFAGLNVQQSTFETSDRGPSFTGPDAAICEEIADRFESIAFSLCEDGHYRRPPSNVPPYVDGAQFARALEAKGWLYHIDDRADDCLAAVATPTECREIQALVDAMPDPERERYFEAAVSMMDAPNIFDDVAAILRRRSPAFADVRAGNTALHVRANGFQTWHFNQDEHDTCQWSATLSLDGHGDEDPICALTLPALDSGSSPAKIAAHILAALGHSNL